MAILKDGKKLTGFSRDLPDQTFSNRADVNGHFQTPSIVFRNFFTPDLLEALEQAAVGKHSSFVESDTLRNYLAFHFGKIRFENSVDAVWRADIRTYGALTKLEQSLIAMQERYQIFDFYSKQFGLDDNSRYVLSLSFEFYLRAVKFFSELLTTLDIFELKAGNYFRERFFGYGESDLEKIVNSIFRQADIFRRLGFELDGNKLRINLPEEYLKAGVSHE